MSAGAVERVVLLDDAGHAMGSLPKASTHTADTPLHLAFSCYVFDDDGSFLTARRALTKKVWPGVWSNSVCGHPAPQESFEDAIARRLRYELGMTVRDVEVVLAEHLYRAPPFGGIVEYEFCPVFAARRASVPEPNPIEVSACAWMDWEEFARRADEDADDVWSWWCKNQLRELRANPLIARYSRPA